MARARFDIIDVISDLLQAEQSGVFHFLAEADPYINRAAADIRRPLQDMIAATTRRETELVTLLDQLGTTPKPIAVAPENQYLAYLSIDFLLPKFREAKLRSIAAYEKALRLVGDENPTAAALLSAHLKEHCAEIQTLDHGLAELDAVKFAATPA